MKKILIPTDFSPNAFIAVQYGCALAEQMGYSVELLHVYIALYAGYDEGEKSTQHMKWANGEATKHMDTLTENIRKSFPNVALTSVNTQGFMIDVLKKKTKDEDYAFIVMGTKGATNVAENLLGSTTFEVIKHAAIPVLVIPENTGDFNLQKVGFFTDFHTSDQEAVAKLFSLLGNNYQFKTIHIGSKDESDVREDSTTWESALSTKYPTVHDFQTTYITANTIDINTITDIKDNQALDLLVFSRPNKSFFQRIFSKSVTKTAINYPVAPSLFIKA